MINQEHLESKLDSKIKKMCKTLRETQILKMRIKGKTLDSIGKEKGLTKERVRQILSAMYRRINMQEEESARLLARFTDTFKFNKQYCYIESPSILWKLRIIVKACMPKYKIINGYLVNKWWWSKEEKRLEDKLKKKLFTKIPPIWTKEFKLEYKSVIFKSVAGICIYWSNQENTNLINCKNIDLLKLIKRIYGNISERSLISVLERTNILNKCGKTLYKTKNGEEREIATKISKIIKSSPYGVIGKYKFLELTNKISIHHNLLDDEAYYIFKYFYRNEFGFSVGNRMLISVNKDIKPIPEFMQDEFGDGPNIIKKYYARDYLGLSETVCVNFDFFYSHNNASYLYLTKKARKELKKCILSFLNKEKSDMISIDKFKKNMQTYTENSKFNLIFYSMALKPILRKIFSNLTEYKLVGDSHVYIERVDL